MQEKVIFGSVCISFSAAVKEHYMCFPLNIHLTSSSQSRASTAGVAVMICTAASPALSANLLLQQGQLSRVSLPLRCCDL